MSAATINAVPRTPVRLLFRGVHALKRQVTHALELIGLFVLIKEVLVWKFMPDWLDEHFMLFDLSSDRYGKATGWLSSTFALGRTRTLEQIRVLIFLHFLLLVAYFVLRNIGITARAWYEHYLFAPIGVKDVGGITQHSGQYQPDFIPVNALHDCSCYIVAGELEGSRVVPVHKGIGALTTGGVLVTARHVVETTRGGFFLVKGDKTVLVRDAFTSLSGDIAYLKLSARDCSMLGLKQAALAQSVLSKAVPVQLRGGITPLASYGMLTSNADSKTSVLYTGKAMPGFSGSPYMAGNKIVGFHLGEVRRGDGGCYGASAAHVRAALEAVDRWRGIQQHDTMDVIMRRFTEGRYDDADWHIAQADEFGPEAIIMQFGDNVKYMSIDEARDVMLERGRKLGKTKYEGATRGVLAKLGIDYHSDRRVFEDLTFGEMVASFTINPPVAPPTPIRRVVERVKQVARSVIEPVEEGYLELEELVSRRNETETESLVVETDCDAIASAVEPDSSGDLENLKQLMDQKFASMCERLDAERAETHGIVCALTALVQEVRDAVIGRKSIQTTPPLATCKGPEVTDINVVHTVVSLPEQQVPLVTEMPRAPAAMLQYDDVERHSGNAKVPLAAVQATGAKPAVSAQSPSTISLQLAELLSVMQKGFDTLGRPSTPVPPSAASPSTQGGSKKRRRGSKNKGNQPKPSAPPS